MIICLMVISKTSLSLLFQQLDSLMSQLFSLFNNIHPMIQGLIHEITAFYLHGGGKLRFNGALLHSSLLVVASIDRTTPLILTRRH